MVGDVNAQLQNVNTQMQQQLGLFNPEIAVRVDAIKSSWLSTAPISIPTLAPWR